jgi:hypothetical protein
MNETVFDVTAAGDLRGQIVDDDGDEMIRMGNAMIFLDLCLEFYMKRASTCSHTSSWSWN